MTSVAWGTQFEPDPMLNWVFMRPHMSDAEDPGAGAPGRGEVDARERRKTYQELYRTAHDEAMWLFVHAQDELVGQAARRAVAALQHHGQQGHRATTSRCPVRADRLRVERERGPRARRASTCA